MALSTAMIWEVRTTGLDTNGGGFTAGATGTDWSQQNAAQYAVADAVTNGTTTITSASANFGTDVVGNVLYITGGTAPITAGWYEIISRSDASTIVVDRAAGLTAGTGATLRIGGALLSPGLATSLLVNNNILYIRNGTYLITSATSNVAGGTLAIATNDNILEGYATTRGDLGTAPVLQASGIATFTLLASPGAGNAVIKNLTLDGASLTSSQGCLCRTNTVVYAVTAKNCTNFGISTTGITLLVRCVATGCSTTAPAVNFGAAGLAYACESYSNTVSGFDASSGAIFDRCLSYNNSGATSRGFNNTANTVNWMNCIAYNNGENGFRTIAKGSTYVNCLAENNAAYGFNSTGNVTTLINCGTYNNTSGSTNLTGVNVTNIGFVTNTTASFFTNGAGGDFSLNNTAGAGATARAAGIPGVFPAGTTTGYLDIGAVQHADPPAGGSAVAIFGG